MPKQDKSRWRNRFPGTFGLLKFRVRSILETMRLAAQSYLGAFRPRHDFWCLEVEFTSGPLGEKHL